jgi:hypothetical protein
MIISPSGDDMTPLTAMEIRGNPHDLCIFVYKEHRLFGFGILRGPGHKYKSLLTSKPYLRTRDEAIEMIAKILRDVAVEASGEGDLLDQKMVERILNGVREKEVANTWQMFTETT